jgi:hypothetical protein
MQAPETELRESRVPAEAGPLQLLPYSIDNDIPSGNLLPQIDVEEPAYPLQQPTDGASIVGANSHTQDVGDQDLSMGSNRNLWVEKPPISRTSNLSGGTVHAVDQPVDNETERETNDAGGYTGNGADETGENMDRTLVPVRDIGVENMEASDGGFPHNDACEMEEEADCTPVQVRDNDMASVGECDGEFSREDEIEEDADRSPVQGRDNSAASMDKGDNTFAGGDVDDVEHTPVQVRDSGVEEMVNSAADGNDIVEDGIHMPGQLLDIDTERTDAYSHAPSPGSTLRANNIADEDSQIQVQNVPIPSLTTSRLSSVNHIRTTYVDRQGPQGSSKRFRPKDMASKIHYGLLNTHC